MAWKGSIFYLRQPINWLALLRNSVLQSEKTNASTTHFKIAFRTRSTACRRRLPASGLFDEIIQCTSVSRVKSCQPAVASFVRGFSVESSEGVEKKSHARTVITYEELKDLINRKQILLIDVREPKEIEETGMMPGAINIPLTKLKNTLSMTEEVFQETFRRAKPPNSGDNLVFYGLSNVRSEAALELAHKGGYKKARHYPGGWQEWSEKETGV